MQIIYDSLSKAVNTILLPGLEKEWADAVRAQFFLHKESLSTQDVQRLLSTRVEKAALLSEIMSIRAKGQTSQRLFYSEPELLQASAAAAQIDDIKLPLLSKIYATTTKKTGSDKKELEKIRNALGAYLSLCKKCSTPAAILESLRVIVEDLGRLTAPYRVSEDAMQRMRKYINDIGKKRIDDIGKKRENEKRAASLTTVLELLQGGKVGAAYELTKRIEAGDGVADSQEPDRRSLTSAYSMSESSPDTAEHQDIKLLFLGPIEKVKREIDSLIEAKSTLLKLAAKDFPELTKKVDGLFSDVKNVVSDVKNITQSLKKGVEVVGSIYDNRATTIAFLLLSLGAISSLAACAGITQMSPLGLAGAASLVGLTLSIFMLALSSVKMYQVYKKEKNNVTEAGNNADSSIHIVRMVLCCAAPALAFLLCIAMSVYEVASGTKIAEGASVDPRIVIITAMVMLIICAYGVTAVLSQINAPEEAQNTAQNKGSAAKKEEIPSTSTENGNVSSAGNDNVREKS